MSAIVLERPNLPWWEREFAGGADPALAGAVIEACQDIEKRQESIQQGHVRHARIYAGYLPSGLAQTAGSTSNMRTPFEATKALVRAVCDTSTAMIVRSRPKATFVTDGADWNLQQSAEDMDQFMVGAYEVGNLYAVAPRSFHDSTVFGTGGWKYVPRGSGEDFKVCYERVLPADIIVDEDECREHLDPQTVFHRTIVRADSLIKKYCSGDDTEDRERRSRLLSATSPSAWPGLNVPKDRLVLVEAYHVNPEAPSENTRVLAANGVTLQAERWPLDFLPFTWLWWNLPITGFYGDGIAYRQYGRQQRVTYMHRWIQKCLDLFATPTAWIDPVGGPPTLQLSNELGKVVSARRPPVFQTQQIVPPEVYNWLNKLESDGFEDEGISQVSSYGDLPPGVDSAPAQRELSFKEGQRFAPVSQRWEHAVAVDTAHKTAEFYRLHAKKGAPARVRWADRRLMYDIVWPDMDRDAYVIRAAPSGYDSLSPAARMQGALELAQTGWIKPEEGRALVGHPDLKEADDLGNAPTSYAKWVLRQLKLGKVVEVDEKADPAILMDIIKRGRLLAVTKRAPVSIVNNMDRYLEALETMMKDAADAALQEQMAQAQAMAPQPGISEQAAEGRPTPFSGGSGYT